MKNTTQSHSLVLVKSDEIHSNIHEFITAYGYKNFRIEPDHKGVDLVMAQKWDLVIIEGKSFDEAESHIFRAISYCESNQIPFIILSDETERTSDILKHLSSVPIIFNMNISWDYLNTLIGKTIREHSQVTLLKDKIIKVGSMEKPLIVKILACVLLCEPLYKIFFTDLTQINTPWKVFEFWFLFPLGGLTLLSRWSWSFLLFIFVQIYAIYLNLTDTSYWWTSVSFFIINSLIIYYFLSKKGMEHFINQKGIELRRVPRFSFERECQLRADHMFEPLHAKIADISVTGAYIETKDKLFINDRLHLLFTEKNREYDLEICVVNVRKKGYGVRFYFKSMKDKKHIKELIKEWV